MIKVAQLVGPSGCNDETVIKYSENFLNEVGKKLNKNVLIADIDEVKEEALPIYFVTTGGTELAFKEIYEKTKEPYVLLTTPAYNSLAAAMEILGFLQDKGIKGEILHGSIESIAKRLSILITVANARKKLSGLRLGNFGDCDALIGSSANFKEVEDVSGIKSILFDLDVFVEEYKKGGYPENEYTKDLMKHNFGDEEMKKALDVYGALKRLIEKHNLQGVSLKCFDLLELLDTTGCLALAILNAEGIPAACEGDQKSMISMAVLEAITGQSSFMSNPSSMDPEKGEIIFAHCTLPIDMADDYQLTTHFESGIGVAVAADIESQVVTIFKCNDDFSRYYAGKAYLIETMHRDDLCRTQMKLKLEDGTGYFSSSPIGNHHMIVKGDWKEYIDEFFRK